MYSENGYINVETSDESKAYIFEHLHIDALFQPIFPNYVYSAQIFKERLGYLSTYIGMTIWHGSHSALPTLCDGNQVVTCILIRGLMFSFVSEK